MLFKKMLRDLWKHKGAYLASALLVLIGILTYNLMSLIYESFDYSLDNYYETYNIGDATLKVTSMPIDSVKRFMDIEGIRSAEGRIQKRVRVIDEDKEVLFRFMSYDNENDKRIDGIELMEGRWPDPQKLEVLMGNNHFAAAHMKLGDQISVAIGGKARKLTVVGTGRSPEFIYIKKNANELISDPETFDMVYMPYQKMSELFGMENQVNNIAFTLYDNDGFEAVRATIEEKADKYGIEELIPLEDQVSHATTMQKLEGIGSMTTAVPMMFLMISATIIFIVLKRIIEAERGQIGVLKACGVPDYMVLIHYMSYALIVGIVGGLPGAYFGIRSVPGMIDLMGIAFNMPFETKGLFEKYMFNSLLMTVSFSVMSGYVGAKRCLALEPAEAMRPPVQVAGRGGMVDKIYWLFEGTQIKFMLALRNITRNPGRSLFILFGVSITAALLTFPLSMNSMYNAMLFDQFEKKEIYDMKISFNTYVTRGDAVRIFENEPGITQVEPITTIPVEVNSKWHKEELGIICFPTDSTLYNLYDFDDKPIVLSSNGLALSHWIAEKMEIEIGDTVELESPLFRDAKRKKLVVTQIIPQYVGSGGYMNIDNVASLLEGKDYVSAVMVNGTDEGLKRVKEKFESSSLIDTFDYSEQIAAGFKEYLSQTTAVIGLLVVVGILIGFSVIYVSMTISISERYRELATMLVVGLTESEVHQVLLIEQVILSVLGILAGLPMGKAMLVGFAESSSTDQLIMPSQVPQSALVFSVVFTIIAIILPQYFARKEIEGIVVTEALNARE